MDKVKFITSNVRGLAEYSKRRDCFHYYCMKQYDIVFLQETHSTLAMQSVWNTQWGSKIWFSHGSSQARGVAILFSKKIDINIHNVITDSCDRYIILYVTINGKKIFLANIYAPNFDDPIFFQTVFKDIKRFTPEYQIIAGDFNLVMDPQIDKKGKQTTHQKAREVIHGNIEALNLVDIWSFYNPEVSEYTWHRLCLNITCCRLDFILVSVPFAQMVDTCQIKPNIRCDHSLVCMEFAFNFSKKGPGFWKLNTSLLKDKDYVQRINNLIDIECAQNYKTRKICWEMIKIGVKGSTIQYSSRKKKAKMNELTALQKKVKNMPGTK